MAAEAMGVTKGALSRQPAVAVQQRHSAAQHPPAALQQLRLVGVRLRLLSPGLQEILEGLHARSAGTDAIAVAPGAGCAVTAEGAGLVLCPSF